MPFAPGQLIANRYEVQVVLNAGAQGEVYRVHDQHLDVVCVIKLLNPVMAMLPGGVWAEAQHLRRLHDDHILEILNADVYLGQPYIVTALAEQGTLDDRLAAAGGTGLPVDDVVAWISQAAFGVQRAHDARLTHNDLKPQNLFLTDRNECLVGDFGLASLIPAPPLVGVAPGASPQTAAPEVAAGWAARLLPAAFTADVFSLGATAFWLLANETPVDFTGAIGLDHMFAVAAVRPQRRLRDVAPHVPGAVAGVIEQALNVNPHNRYQSAGELANALTRRRTRERRWRRTNEHAGHVGCWRGERPGRSTYVLCVEPGANANSCVVVTKHAVTSIRVANATRACRTSDWPRAVRVIVDRLSS